MLLLVIAVSALATIPVWLPPFPPMTDMPQHASQIALLKNLQDPRFVYTDLFNINWFTPYLFGYLLIYASAPFLGIVAACKLIVSISIAALPVSTALVMRETGADEYWALLSIPAMYGFSYYWGLINFIVATPIGILFLCLVIRYFRNGGKKRLLWVAVLLNLLFFCHILICAFVALIALCYIACESRSIKRTLQMCAIFSSVLPLALLWLWKSHQFQPAHYDRILWDLGWFDTVDPYYKSLAAWAEPIHAGWGRISGFVPRLLGVEPRLAYVAVAATLFFLPLLAGSKLSRRFASWVPLLVCIIVLLLAPNLCLGTAFIFQRFTVFALPFFLIALTSGNPITPAQTRLCRVAALLIVSAWISAIYVRTQAYDRAAEGFDGALAAMEPNQRVLSLDFVRDSSVTIAPSFAHFASWYAAEKRGIVDPSSALWYVELVRYKPGQIPKAKLWDFEWNPAEFAWDSYQGDIYRYFLVSSLSDQGRYIFQNARCPVHLKYSANIWWLYEQDPQCQAQHTSLASAPMKNEITATTKRISE